MLIGGNWSTGAGAAVDVLDPSTEARIATVAGAAPDEVAAAVAAARSAQKRWAALASVERSAYVRAIADVLERNREALAETLVREVGKPIGQARGEIDWAVGYARYTAEWDRRIEGDIVPSDNRNEAIHLMRVPYGVVAAIIAWNYPIGVLIRKLAPAILTGNTVVAKASEQTPLATLELARLVHEEVGLPDGVFNVVTGAGDVGRALVESPAVDLITMTGHRDTGRQIMAAAAANLTPVSLERRRQGAGDRPRGRRPRRGCRRGDRGPPREQRAGLHLRRAGARRGADLRRVRRALCRGGRADRHRFSLGRPRDGAARERRPAREGERLGRRRARRRRDARDRAAAARTAPRGSAATGSRRPC